MTIEKLGIFAVGSALGAFVGKVRSFFISIKQYAIHSTILSSTGSIKTIVSFFKSNFKILDRFKPKVYYKDSFGNDKYLYSSRLYKYKGLALYKNKVLCWVELSFSYPWFLRVDYVRGTISEERLIDDFYNFNDVKNENAFRSRRFYIDVIVDDLTSYGENVAASGSAEPRTSPGKQSEFHILEDFPFYDYGVTFEIEKGDRSRYLSHIGSYESPEHYLRRRFPYFYWSKEFKELLVEGLFWQKLNRLRSKGMVSRSSRGCLLFGPPGSGKTMLVNMVARYLDVPISVVDLNTISELKFVTEVSSLMQRARIILYEDIDLVFDGRKNRHRDTRLKERVKFNTFLNMIDGINKDTYAWTIITTNRPEKLDSALVDVSSNQISRPGRIDKVIEVGPIDDRGKEFLLRYLLSSFFSEEEINIWFEDIRNRKMMVSQVLHFCEEKIKHYLYEELLGRVQR